MSRSRRRGPGRRSPRFEPLEDRLAMAVTLAPAPLSDIVTVSPAPLHDFLAAARPLASSFVGEPWRGPAVQTAGANQTIESDGFFSVDVNQTYALSGWAKSGDEFGQRISASNLQSFGLMAYDADRLTILPHHVLRFASATDTMLAAPLMPGATTIQLANAAGWSNAVGAAADTRVLAWYGYQDSEGTTYADYTYTRNVATGGASGLWAPGAISGNVITLAAPWDGPALPAGAAVRNATGGDAASFWALDSEAVPGDWSWSQYAGVFGDQAFASGTPAAGQFRPGTAFVRPIIIANEHGALDNFITWRDVAIVEVASGTTADKLAPVVVDLTDPGGPHDIHALPLSPGSPHFWSSALAKVDTVDQYVLSARSLNVVEFEERPVGFASLDVDGKLIHPLHVTRHAFAVDTTLAAALAPGATSILINDASGWSNGPTESAETRSLAWYGYMDSTGHTYADYTYTRNVAFDFDEGLWASEGIRYDPDAGAYRITLREPWAGPALAAGSAIRNAASGALYQQPETAPGLDTAERITDYAVTFGGGEWQNGERGEQTFRPGTAFIQPVFASYSVPTSASIARADATIGLEPLVAGANREVSLDLDVLLKEAFDVAFEPLEGDYNRDGRVDAGDYVRWRNQLGADGLEAYSGADGNGDGEVTQQDYQTWKTNYGETAAVVIDSVVQPHHGTATIAEGNGERRHGVIRYRSDPWFVGTDVVTYTLRNTLTGETLTTSAAIHVLGGNHEQNAALADTLDDQAQVVIGNVAPATQDEFDYEVTAGETLVVDGVVTPSLLANDSDPVDELVVRLVAGTQHGTLNLNYDGTFTYTPAFGFTGVDSFLYDVFDGLHATTASAWIVVQPLEVPLASQYDAYLRDIYFALRNYVDSIKSFPVRNNPAYFDDDGNPYLSWRVHILPFLGYQDLYRQFNLSEPWYSETNMPLLDQMPVEFRSLGDAAESTTTRMMTFTGPDAPFGFRPAGTDQIGPSLSQITDGLSNTLLLVEAGADMAAPWTKPVDLPFDINDPLAAVGDLSAGTIRGIFFDGSRISIPADISPTAFAALVTRRATNLYPIDEMPDEELGQAANLAYREQRRIGQLVAPGEQLNNIRQIALAMHNFNDVYKRFPWVGNSTYFDEQGFPLLSWRVYLLPYLEQGHLFSQFHLDEPWDSPHNLALLDQMPDIFRSFGDPADSVTTRIQTFTGPGAPFLSQPGGDQLGPRGQDITDGWSKTIMFVESGADAAVLWTKPVDLPFWMNNPRSSLSDIGHVFLTAMFDGSAQYRSGEISIDELSALITHQGNEDIFDPPPIVNLPNFYIRQLDGDTVLGEFDADAFYVVLDKAPLAPVVLDVELDLPGVATLDKSALTFTPDNWDVPQRVIVRGIDNFEINADQLVAITVSVNGAPSSDEYDLVAPQAFSALVQNDDLLYGDYNGDGRVDAGDYVRWRNTLGDRVYAYTAADGNGNEIIDSGDYAMWKANYGNAAPMSGAGGLATVRAMPAARRGHESVVALVAAPATSDSRPGAGTLTGRDSPMTAALNDHALLAWLTASTRDDRRDFEAVSHGDVVSDAESADVDAAFALLGEVGPSLLDDGP